MSGIAEHFVQLPTSCTVRLQRDICRVTIGRDLLFKIKNFGSKCVAPSIYVEYSSDNVIITINNLQVVLTDNNMVPFNIIIKKTNGRWEHQIEEVKVNIFIMI